MSIATFILGTIFCLRLAAGVLEVGFWDLMMWVVLAIAAMAVIVGFVLLVNYIGLNNFLIGLGFSLLLSGFGWRWKKVFSY